jgi:hypothetical protein
VQRKGRSDDESSKSVERRADGLSVERRAIDDPPGGEGAALRREVESSARESE